jgi:hypothetical protein
MKKIIVILLLLASCVEDPRDEAHIFFYIYHNGKLREFAVVPGKAAGDCVIGSPRGYCCKGVSYVCFEK